MEVINYLKQQKETLKKNVNDITSILKLTTERKATHEKVKASLSHVFGCNNLLNNPAYIKQLLEKFVQFINLDPPKGYANYANTKSYMTETKNTQFNTFMKNVYSKMEGGWTAPSTGQKTFQILFTFAIDYCNAATIQGEVSLVVGHKGGAGDLVVYTERNSRKWIYVISIVFVLYYLFVLFESYRTLSLSMDRILQARKDYLEIYPQEEDQTQEDKTFMVYIFSFFKIMHQAVSGVMIQMLNTLDGEGAMNLMTDLFKSTSSQTLQNEVESCGEGYFACFNDWLTGIGQARLSANTLDIVNRDVDLLFIQKKYELRKLVRDLRTDIHSSTTNIITAVNGLSFTFILLLHTLLPNRYNSVVVGTSIGLLCSSYTTNPLIAMRCTSAQLVLLISPNIYGYLTGPTSHAQFQQITNSEESETEITTRSIRTLTIEIENPAPNDLEAIAKGMLDLGKGDRWRGGKTKKIQKYNRRTLHNKMKKKSI